MPLTHFAKYAYDAAPIEFSVAKFWFLPTLISTLLTDACRQCPLHLRLRTSKRSAGNCFVHFWAGCISVFTIIRAEVDAVRSPFTWRKAPSWSLDISLAPTLLRCWLLPQFFKAFLCFIKSASQCGEWVNSFLFFISNVSGAENHVSTSTILCTFRLGSQ